MKKLVLLLLVAASTVSAATFNLFTPATGVLKGSATTYVTTAATSLDIKTLWSGTCDSTTYLRGDGSCQTPPGTGGGTVNSVALSAPSVFGVSGSPVTTTGTLALSFATGQTSNSFLATPDGTTGALSLRTILNADLPTVNVVHGGTGVATITGPVKGNGTSAFSAAAAADIYGLWSGTCNSSSFLRGDGACASPGTVTSVALTVPSGFSITGSPITTSGTLAISGTLNPVAGGTGVATLTGIAKGNGTSAFTAAASGDVTGLWGGTCNATTYLRGDGSCVTPPTGGSGANPSASVGLTAVNGSASTFMRSDGAPAISQSISPTWTGYHIFAPVSGKAIAIYSLSAQLGISIASGSSGSTTQADVSITRAGSTANNIAQGPTLDLTDTTNSTATEFQHSGGQTELWQYNAGWNQIWKINSNRGMVLNAPVSGVALTASATSTTAIGVSTTGYVASTAWQQNGTIDTASNVFNGIYGKASNTIGIATNGSERFIFGPSGQLGIGGATYGTSGQVLTSQGSSSPPVWTTVAATTSGTGSLSLSSGCTAGNSATYSYRLSGNFVTLWITQGGGLTCTSNSTGLLMTGLASGVTPATTHSVAIAGVEDNGNFKPGWASVDTSGNITMYVWNGTTITSSGFTSSGTKGVPFQWSVTYPID